MHRLRFRLQRVFEIRQHEEEAAKNELAIENRRLHEAEDRLQDLEIQLAAADEQFAERQRGPIGIDELRGMQAFREKLAHDIRLQKTVVRLAEERVEAATQKVVEAMKRRRALELLREKHYEEFKYEEERFEQQVLDEQGLNVFRIKKEESVSVG